VLKHVYSETLLPERLAKAEKVIYIRKSNTIVINFHFQQHTIMENAISQLQIIPSAFNRGAVCLLKVRQYHCKLELKVCVTSFSQFISPPEILFLSEVNDKLSVNVIDNEVDVSDDDIDSADKASYIQLIH